MLDLVKGKCLTAKLVDGLEEIGGGWLGPFLLDSG